MDSVNTLRVLLAVGALLAGISAIALGQTVAGIVLLAAVVPHAWLSWHLWRRTPRPPES